MLKQGNTIHAVMAEYPSQYIRYSNGIHKMYNELIKMNTPEWRKVKVVAFVGPAGTGKSKLVRDRDPMVFNVNMNNKTEFLFNGYKNEKSILFDDFYNQVDYEYMLQILDGYRLQLNIKNGDTMAQWDTVYFTSNRTPSLWWGDGLRSMARRITELWEVLEGNTIPLTLKSKKKYD